MEQSIAIVIGAWNCARFLPATLASIQAQTISDWECVIVDDGSKDDTAASAQQYIRADKRFRFVRQDQAGPSAARNRGWAESNPAAEYFTFMDHDDLWVPDALEVLRNELREHPEAPGAHGLAEFIDQQGNPQDAGQFSAFGRDRKGFENGKIVPWPPSRPTSFESLLWENKIFPPGVLLMRRSFLEKTGPFALDLRLTNDWDFVQRLSRHGDIRFLDRVIVLYRRHAGNASAESDKANRDAVRMQHYRNYFCKDYDENQRALVRASWRAWQILLLGEKWRSVRRQLRCANIRGAAIAFAQTAMQLYRYFRGYPTRKGI